MQSVPQFKRRMRWRRMIHYAEIPWAPDQPTTDGGVSPEHWYRSDGPVWQDAGLTRASSDGDPVGRWEDKAGNDDHVNQAVAGSKPTYQSGAGDLLNNHPVIRADGADDYLKGAYTTGGQMNQPNTILGVAKLDATVINDGNYHVLCDGDDGTHRHRYYQYPTPNPDAWSISSGANLSGNATDSSWHIFTAVYNGAASALWLDGVLEAGPGNAGVEAMDGLTLFSTNNQSVFWKGDLAEWIIYDANLSNADKNQVGQYLATRYSLSYTDI